MTSGLATTGSADRTTRRSSTRGGQFLVTINVEDLIQARLQPFAVERLGQVMIHAGIV